MKEKLGRFALRLHYILLVVYVVYFGEKLANLNLEAWLTWIFNPVVFFGTDAFYLLIVTGAPIYGLAKLSDWLLEDTNVATVKVA